MTRLAVPVNADDHLRGSPAPIMLVEYGDYECPHCGRAHPVVLQLLQALGDQLAVVYRHFPLAQIHPHAQHAAEAAEAAAALGGEDAFWQMHDTMFANQHALDDDDLMVYARDIGLDPLGVADALATGKFAPRVRQDFMGGVRSGVNGTPTFFINGERYDGDWSNVRAFASALASSVSQPTGKSRPTPPP